MAEFSPPTIRAVKNKSSRKILTTKVDLTPMVDLGFLLITFFIFTTSMSQPKSLKIKFPDDRNIRDSLETAEGKTLNLILGKDNHLWYYNGSKIEEIKESNYGSGIRLIIQNKKKYVSSLYNDGKELVILVKPTRYSSVENIVGILNEMMINEVSRYVLMEPTKEEIAITVK